MYKQLPPTSHDPLALPGLLVLSLPPHRRARLGEKPRVQVQKSTPPSIAARGDLVPLIFHRKKKVSP